MKTLCRLFVLLLSITAALAQPSIDWSKVRYWPYGAAAGNTAELRIRELAANGTNYVGFKAPDAITANKIWVLPATDSTGTQCLSSDGSLVLGWTSCATASAGGWTDDGTVVRLTTATDQVGVGTASPISGVTMQVEESATGAIGGDLWITNSGVNAVGSSARLVFGPDATTDTTPNWAVEAIVTATADFRADLVLSAYDGSSYAEKARFALPSNGATAALRLGIGSDTAPAYSFLGTNNTAMGMWMDTAGPSTSKRLLFNAGGAAGQEGAYRLTLGRAVNAPEPTGLSIISNQTSSNPDTAYNEIYSVDKTGTPVVIGLKINAEHLELTGIKTTSNATADSARFYVVDAGGGKDRVVICFESGACQTVATEP